jgi:2-keto-3-deoxy-L-fuconate dehydrogenase
MSGRLAGKTALVTAAGQGMGYACAVQMAAEGATVYATDVNPKLLEQFGGMRGVIARPLDVLDDAAVRRTIDELPALDVLFNCAGYVHHGSILDCTPKDWDFSMNLNVRAMYVAIQAAAPKMLDKHQKTGQWASIINMASVAGSIKGLPNRFVYGTSKAAVIGLTKSLGKELAKTGIRVNCVTPAAVRTAIFDQMTQQHIDFMLSKIPLGRFGTVEEIAAMVCWLASEDCSFSTGAVFDLSGGRATY